MYKNIAFVAHEFGLFSGHGGIASYLYNICKYLISKNHIVSVLCMSYDKNTDLLNYNNFSIYEIKNEIDVYNNLKKINADYVEVADYLGLCLYSLKQKALNLEFKDTIFAVHHHTASRECFEWNALIPLKYANTFIKTCYMNETQQILFADIQIAPSIFMANYVKKNYKINEHIYVFNHINISEDITKEEIRQTITQHIDITPYMDSFNIFLITRIEGRKNQELLIDQFIKFKNELKINTHLFLAGNTNKDEITGEEYNYKLYKKIPESDRANIHFYNFLDRESQKKIIAIGDLCILPSPFESFSIALGETILKGIPGMASIYTGCKDYIGETQDIMCFDPFKNNDLLQHIKNFYYLPDNKKKEILKKQQETFRHVTNPNLSVEKRLVLYNSYKPSIYYLSEHNWIFVDDKSTNYIQKSGVILISNHLNDELIHNIINKYTFNNNFRNKIIVLCGQNEYINDLQDIINKGLPILIPHYQNLNTIKVKLLYYEIINFLIKNQDIIVFLSVDNIKQIPNNKFVNYVLTSQKQLNLMDRL